MTATTREEAAVAGRPTRATHAPTRWCRWLERLVLVFPVVVGAGVVGVLAGAPVPEVQRAVLLGVAVAAASLRVGIPAFLYLDARALDRDDARWSPDRLLYPIAALLVSAPLVALVYLYRRFERVQPPPTGSHWWLAVGLSAVLGPLTLAIGLTGTAVPAGAALAIAATVAAGLLPVGIYRDAAYVRREAADWNPNPALYLGFAFLSLLVAVLQPLVALGYLAKRHATFRQ